MKLLFIILIFLLLPPLAYFCVKFGTYGYYKAKELIENDKRN